MVSPDKKKHPALRSKTKPKVVDAFVSDSEPEEKQTKSVRPKKKIQHQSGPSTLVSALIFNDDSRTKNLNAQRITSALKPVSASIFTTNISGVAFANKLRNILEYTFETLRDSIADQTPIGPNLERSIEEMKSLSAAVAQRLKTETQRRFIELIEETEAFAKGEKTALTPSDDHQGAQHYRHYVRIAWLTRFILDDLNASDL